MTNCLQSVNILYLRSKKHTIKTRQSPLKKLQHINNRRLPAHAADAHKRRLSEENKQKLCRYHGAENKTNRNHKKLHNETRAGQNINWHITSCQAADCGSFLLLFLYVSSVYCCCVVFLRKETLSCCCKNSAESQTDICFSISELLLKRCSHDALLPHRRQSSVCFTFHTTTDRKHHNREERWLVQMVTVQFLYETVTWKSAIIKFQEMQYLRILYN